MSGGRSTMAQPTAVKDAARAAIEDRLDDLVQLSHSIHEHPETAFEEDRAAAWTAGRLADGGLHGDHRHRGHAHGVQRRGGDRTPGRRRLRRVRRSPRRGPRLRPQPHRRRRRRGRAGPGRGGRRSRRDGPGARHAGRGGRRGQGHHAGDGVLRRRPRGDDGPPLARGPAQGHVPGRLPLRRRRSTGKSAHASAAPWAGSQRRRRHGRHPGGHRPPPPAAPPRATRSTGS